MTDSPWKSPPFKLMFREPLRDHFHVGTIVEFPWGTVRLVVIADDRMSADAEPLWPSAPVVQDHGRSANWKIP